MNTAMSDAINIIDNQGLIPATGVGGLWDWMPNTDALALRNKLDTIKANVGFDKLQAMRDNSPTGGALGQVSEFENRLLQATSGSLDQLQTADELKARIEAIQKAWQGLQQAYEDDFREFYGIPEDARKGKDGNYYRQIDGGRYERWMPDFFER